MRFSSRPPGIHFDDVTVSDTPVDETTGLVTDPSYQYDTTDWQGPRLPLGMGPTAEYPAGSDVPGPTSGAIWGGVAHLVESIGITANRVAAAGEQVQSQIRVIPYGGTPKPATKPTPVYAGLTPTSWVIVGILLLLIGVALAHRG